MVDKVENQIKGWKMNKPKRFHFVSFSFKIFSAKLISINNFKKLLKID